MFFIFFEGCLSLLDAPQRNYLTYNLLAELI